MSERITTSTERTPEEARIFERISAHFNGEHFIERKKIADESGLFVWEFIRKSEDGDTKISYIRKGRTGTEFSTSAAIDVVYYDESGTPVGGDTLEEIEE